MTKKANSADGFGSSLSAQIAEIALFGRLVMAGADRLARASETARPSTHCSSGEDGLAHAVQRADGQAFGLPSLKGRARRRQSGCKLRRPVPDPDGRRPEVERQLPKLNVAGGQEVTLLEARGEGGLGLVEPDR